MWHFPAVEPEEPEVAPPIPDAPSISRESEKLLGALLIPLGVLIALSVALQWAPVTLLLIVVHVLMIATIWMRKRLRERVEAQRRPKDRPTLPFEMSALEAREYFERHPDP